MGAARPPGATAVRSPTPQGSEPKAELGLEQELPACPPRSSPFKGQKLCLISLKTPRFWGGPGPGTQRGGRLWRPLP